MRLNVFHNLILLAILFSGLMPCAVLADELQDLGFTDQGNGQNVSAARSPRPASEIAENITVITANDIARLNAHTLAEVLQTVSGIQLDYQRTPSTFTFFNIQGAHNTTVLVLIDGIRQNDFDQNAALPGLIPVQQIERIEIVKGAASAAWGPALGGVINIITKSPNPEREAGGMISGSIGDRFTTDSRAELSGTLKRFGYYLTVGNIHSDGLTPNTGTNLNHLYTKLSWLLPGNGTATFGLSHLNAKPGLDEADTGPALWGFVHDNNEYRRTNSFIKISQPLGPLLSLDMDGYATDRDDRTRFGGRDQGAIVFFNDYQVRESSLGTNARLTWGNSQSNLTTGVEYRHARTRYADLLSTDPPINERNWDSWGLYANGTYTIGALTILPGIRQDYTGISGDNLSYTLGATYKLAGSTVLRAYAGKGYTLPQARLRNNLQKIVTVQGGIESGAIPYLWLKGTWFYNTLRNSESLGQVVVTNQDRRGFEIEGRTTPVAGFSLTSGYTFVYARNADTGERLKTNSEQSVPPHTLKLALNYDQADLGLRGALTGAYVFWDGADYPVSDQGMIWDLHLTWKILPASDLSPELFFSGHNLFNVNQTTYTILYNSAPRWFEGGLRVRF